MYRKHVSLEQRYIRLKISLNTASGYSISLDLSLHWKELKACELSTE